MRMKNVLTSVDWRRIDNVLFFLSFTMMKIRMKNVLTSVDWRRIADQRTKLPLIDTVQTLMQCYIKYFYFWKTDYSNLSEYETLSIFETVQTSM